MESFGKYFPWLVVPISQAVSYWTFELLDSTRALGYMTKLVLNDLLPFSLSILMASVAIKYLSEKRNTSYKETSTFRKLTLSFGAYSSILMLSLLLPIVKPELEYQLPRETLKAAGLTSESILIGDGNIFFILMAFISVISEELLFRRTLIPLFNRKLGIASSVVLSSLFFGLAHYWGGQEKILWAFVSGLIFSIVYLRLGLRWSIGCHALNNFPAMLKDDFRIDPMHAMGNWGFLLFLILVISTMIYFLTDIFKNRRFLSWSNPSLP